MKFDLDVLFIDVRTGRVLDARTGVGPRRLVRLSRANRRGVRRRDIGVLEMPAAAEAGAGVKG